MSLNSIELFSSLPCLFVKLLKVVFCIVRNSHLFILHSGSFRDTFIQVLFFALLCFALGGIHSSNSHSQLLRISKVVGAQVKVGLTCVRSSNLRQGFAFSLYRDHHLIRTRLSGHFCPEYKMLSALYDVVYSE